MICVVVSGGSRGHAHTHTLIHSSGDEVCDETSAGETKSLSAFSARSRAAGNTGRTSFPPVMDYMGEWRWGGERGRGRGGGIVGWGPAGSEVKSWDSHLILHIKNLGGKGSNNRLMIIIRNAKIMEGGGGGGGGGRGSGNAAASLHLCWARWSR